MYAYLVHNQGGYYNSLILQALELLTGRVEPSSSSSESITRGSLFLISLTILTAWSSSSHWGSRSGRVGKYSLLATLSWTSNNAFKTVKHTGAIIQKIPSRSLWLNAIQKHELENIITNHGSYISSAPALMIFTSRINNTVIFDCWHTQPLLGPTYSQNKQSVLVLFSIFNHTANTKWIIHSIYKKEMYIHIYCQCLPWEEALAC